MTDAAQETNFVGVLNSELEALLDAPNGQKNLRSEPPVQPSSDSVYTRAYDANLCGIAFSGGGIRSATFSLGIIQGLAKRGLLSKFDYLSTVSGGGYIGSWLSALLHRHSKGDVDSDFVDDFQSRLTTHPCKDASRACDESSGFKEPFSSGFPPVEHSAVRFLRGYSNYLTPRLGLSGDVLALVSLFIRNLVLIQIVLVILLSVVLLIPYFFASISEAIHTNTAGLPMSLRSFLYLGASIIFYALYSCGRLVSMRKRIANKLEALTAAQNLSESQKQQRERLRKERLQAAQSVIVRVILPIAFAAWLLITTIASDDSMKVFLTSRITWAVSGTVIYAGVWALGFAISRVRLVPEKKKARQPDSHLFWVSVDDSRQPLFCKRTWKLLAWLLSAAAVSGGLLGYLLFEGANFIHLQASSGRINIWQTVAFGPPLFFLAVSLVVTLHIGASRHAFNEHDREWWARLGGFILLVAAGWALLFGVVIYSPPIIYWLGTGGIAAVAAWISASAAGAWIARNAAGSPQKGNKLWKHVAVRVAPWLFVAGLAIILSCTIYVAVIKYAGLELEWITLDLSLADATRLSAEQQAAIQFRYVLHALLVVLVLAAVATRVLDINVFSAHSLYKNRLTRAYLGASRAGERRAHPFTGFDPADDLELRQLKRQRPLHILNTTINMTGGDDLAWQTRRAASFAMTPYFAGFEAKSTQGAKLGQYRPTSEFAGGITLGTAMAVSGAAASPNMGYHTSPSVAALMTAFNLRLGYWAGNPTAEWQWREKSPRNAIWPILSEMTGSAKEQSHWISLSDGGHFDNLGIYELVRRRCRLIVVTDAGCDPKHTFDDLANTIRKCWTDFGVHIYFDSLKELRLRGKRMRHCNSQSALGKISYPGMEGDGTKRQTGRILYVKCSLTKAIHDKFADIAQYADSHDRFPHETTADQFFDENQFEAYRHLGFVAASEAITKFENELTKLFQP